MSDVEAPPFDSEVWAADEDAELSDAAEDAVLSDAAEDADWSEAELDAGGWFVVDAAPDDVFTSEPDRVWTSVLRRQGGRLAMFASAPPHPSLN